MQAARRLISLRENKIFLESNAQLISLKSKRHLHVWFPDAKFTRMFKVL